MISIRELVQSTLTTGYLSLEAENQLRTLLQQTKYGLDDLQAFTRLQQAAMEGQIIQQSREMMRL